MDSMHVYRLGRSGDIDKTLTLQTEPTPKPGKGEVLVKIRAVSLNYRDLLVIKKTYPLPMKEEGTDVIPCSDGAGDVVQLGEGVKDLKIGDKVYGLFSQSWMGGEPKLEYLADTLGGGVDGTLAQFRVFKEEGVIKYPEYLSYEEAATLPCAAITAWHCLFGPSCGSLPGSQVLTLGTGGVSIFALQFAKAGGARVIITSSSDEKLRRAKELGADALINYKKTPEWDKEARRMTQGRGVDHVIEIGGSGTFPLSVSSTAFGGRVHLVGVLSKQKEPVDIATRIMSNYINVRGIITGSKEMYEKMNRAMELHRIKPVIDRVFEFSHAKDAYHYLESGSHFGKIVIKVD